MNISGPSHFSTKVANLQDLLVGITIMVTMSEEFIWNYPMAQVIFPEI